MRTLVSSAVAFVALGALMWAQNVGIGTAFPTHRLHVAGAGRFDDALEVMRPSDGTNAAILNLHNPSVSPGVYWSEVVRSGDNNKLQWYRWDGSSWLHVW